MTEHAFAHYLGCHSAGGRSFLCPGGFAGWFCIFEHVGAGCCPDADYGHHRVRFHKLFG